MDALAQSSLSARKIRADWNPSPKDPHLKCIGFVGWLESLNTFTVEPRSNAGFALAKEAHKATTARPRVLSAWLEIGAVFLLILCAIWTPMGPANTTASLLAVACILWFTARSSFTLHDLGFTARPSGTLITLGLGLLLAAIVVVGGVAIRPVLGPSHPVPMDRAWQYAIWAVMQEFILQSFFYLRLKSVLGHRRAALVAALLFAAVHLPSPVLTVLSFIGGLLFCELFHRYRNLVPIGLVHALLGLTIAATLPDSLLHHMRVGIGYLTYHP